MMDVSRTAFETMHSVELRRKPDDWVMKIFGAVFPSTRRMWTTYRLPFRKARICYPDFVVRPMAYTQILGHELYHVRQLRPWWGPLWIGLLVSIFPLPVLFSGRWFVERGAYLHDIRTGGISPERAAAILWHGYAWPWPPKWMLRWFRRELAKIAPNVQNSGP